MSVTFLTPLIKLKKTHIFYSSLGDLNDNVGHSLSSAFRPVIFKSYEAKDDLPTTRTTSKPDHANSPETGCSEVSTTVDRDDPSGEDGGKRGKTVS